MEKPSNSSLALNKLANLCIRAFYAYGWVRDIFKKDCLLQKLTDEFIQKAEVTKVCCQRVLDYMFKNGIPFVLLDSTGKFDLDLSKVFSLKNEIKDAINESIRAAEDIQSESLKSFLNLLLRENVRNLGNEQLIQNNPGEDKQNLTAATPSGANTPEQMAAAVHNPSTIISSCDSGIEEKSGTAEHKASSSELTHYIRESETPNGFRGQNMTEQSKLDQLNQNASFLKDFVLKNSSSELQSSSTESEISLETMEISSTSVTESNPELDMPTLLTTAGSNYKIIPTNKTSLEMENEIKELAASQGKPEQQAVKQHRRPESLDKLEAVKDTSPKSIARKTPIVIEGEEKPTTVPDMALPTEIQNYAEVLPPKSILILTSQNMDASWMSQIVLGLNKLHPEIKLFITRSVSVEHKNELQMLKVVKVFHNHKRHHIDMTIIVGSDKSTILQAGMLFPQTAPPMIEFSLEIAKRARRSSFFKRQIQAIFKTFGNPGRLVRHQLRLNCTIHPQFGNPVDSCCAINEVSIHRGDYAKAIEFDVLIGSKRLTMSGDGLVVATPFGSTAYTQALGGSILESTLSCFQLVPICSASEKNTSYILQDNTTIKVTLTKGLANVSVDGRPGTTLNIQDHVIIAASVNPLQWIINKDGNAVSK